MIKLFLIIGTAHFIGDYLLYSQRVSESKRSKSIVVLWWYNILHAIVHAAIVMVALEAFGYGIEFAILMFKVIFVVHFLIDVARCLIEVKILKYNTTHAGWKDLYRILRDKKWHIDKKYIVSGITDQFVHLVSLILISGVMV